MGSKDNMRTAVCGFLEMNAAIFASGRISVYRQFIAVIAFAIITVVFTHSVPGSREIVVIISMLN